MKKAIPRRYWLFIAVALFGGIGLLLLWPQAPAIQASLPPTQVILTRANVVDRGVQLEWLAAQPGSYPIKGYTIERSSGNNEFTYIARVEHRSLKYLDNEGQLGDLYRITAQDDQASTTDRKPSEALAATPNNPSERFVKAPPARVLSLTDNTNQANKGVFLRDSIAQAFVDLDAALGKGNNGASLLHTLQGNLQQALALLTQLSPADQKLLSQVCTEHIPVFETNHHILPEDLHLDALLVIASCDTILEFTQ